MYLYLTQGTECRNSIGISLRAPLFHPSGNIDKHRDGNLPCGWSTVDGQAQSPYVFGGLRDLADDGLGGHSVSTLFTPIQRH